MLHCPASSPLSTSRCSCWANNKTPVTMTEKMVTSQPRPFVSTMSTGQWSSGICDCFDDLPMCCLAFWCYACFTCKTAAEAGECLCLPLLDGCGIIPPITTSLRVSIRTRYGIEGTICQDCVHAWFCSSCTWCQIARELKMRKNNITFISMSP